MGLSFSNIQVHMERPLDEALAGRIAEILMRGTDAEPVADASEADVVVRVCAGKDSPWVAVLADSIDDDLEEQLLKTRALSEALEARTLAIACFDSDYLCLNLVDAETRTDIWAAHGKFPFGKAPRRSNPAAWKAYVKDAGHFAQTLRAPSVFAEDALPDLAAELALPVEQARCMEGEIPEDARFFQFGYKMKEAEGETPPRFGMLYEERYYGVERTKCIPFLNKGGASKGVAVALTGECIREHQIKVEKIELQFHSKRGEWAHIPLRLEETTYDDGSSRQGLRGPAQPLLRQVRKTSNSKGLRGMLERASSFSLCHEFTLLPAKIMPFMPFDSRAGAICAEIMPLNYATSL